MNPKDFIKGLFTDFFIVFTLVTIATGVLGLTLDSDRTFGYDAYFSPLLFSVLSMLPSVVMYSKRELTIRQMLFRKLLQLLLIEFLLLGFTAIIGYCQLGVLFPQGIAILLIYYAVAGISWLLDLKSSRELNKELAEYQSKKEISF